MATAPARVPDLTALALLRDVARTGSLSAAAEGMGLTVQAASARIRAAEQQAGGPVLERGRRGRRSSRLTTRGVLLVEWAGALLAAASDLDVAVAALRDEPVGDDGVVLAADPVVAECLLRTWLVELRDGPGGAGRAA
ncbi:LysR family transcriptional regulator [Pseudonocardia sp. ICBG1293]|uniref:LysR family transcriptional regulator n=1 Tax=Pseudonocardia sp. ICBG1293 TaxID=2844382 RepID=UPI001CC962AE|nr:LysR family transcriptional regulator [Pseudonocardia sp. ICBG1293]